MNRADRRADYRSLRRFSAVRAGLARLGVTPEQIEELALSAKACVSPVPLRGTSPVTGESQVVGTPCKCTLAAKCPSCADRARQMRVQQARDGLFLDVEPPIRMAHPGPDLDDEEDETDTPARTVRSTARRNPLPLPTRRVDPSTLGECFGEHGQHRPAAFITLTCPSYGPVHEDGSPVNPDRYDYESAVRDMLCWSKLVNRFVLGLRRCGGKKYQYFAGTEPQRRAAPHTHMLVRGSPARVLVKQLVERLDHAEYRPDCSVMTHAPGDVEWVPELGRYIDRDGLVLPTVHEASAEVTEPWHVARFGDQHDYQGFTADDPEFAVRVFYTTKYASKSAGDVLDAESGSARYRRHIERLHALLAVTPCCSECELWVLYGCTPDGIGEDGPSARSVTGRCNRRAHKPEHVGVIGRRIITSRQWVGYTLPELREQRAENIRQTLSAGGIEPDPDPRSGWTYEMPGRNDPDVPDRTDMLVTSIAERARMRAQYEAALRYIAEQSADPVPVAV